MQSMILRRRKAELKNYLPSRLETRSFFVITRNLPVLLNLLTCLRFSSFSMFDVDGSCLTVFTKQLIFLHLSWPKTFALLEIGFRYNRFSIISPHVHFTPRSFHPTFISPHVHFTPRSFHPKFISPHVHFTPHFIQPKASQTNCNIRINAILRLNN